MRLTALRLMMILALLLVTASLVLPVTAMAAPYDTKNWMKYLPDSMPITEINMPGTHDSGTAHMGGPAFNPLARCQYDNIKDQMNKGLRVFDIRLTGEGKPDDLDDCFAMNLCHNFLSCDKSGGCSVELLYLSDVADWARSFLKDHPTETVVWVCSAENHKD